MGIYFGGGSSAGHRPNSTSGSPHFGGASGRGTLTAGPRLGTLAAGPGLGTLAGGSGLEAVIGGSGPRINTGGFVPWIVTGGFVPWTTLLGSFVVGCSVTVVGRSGPRCSVVRVHDSLLKPNTKQNNKRPPNVTFRRLRRANKKQHPTT